MNKSNAPKQSSKMALQRKCASMTRLPEIFCNKCGCSGAETLKMSVTYRTSRDLLTGHDEHRHVSTVYELKCQRCGNVFSVTIDAEDA
jgi:membrane protease subunit (stomatin/prohibitin family)